MSVDLTEAKKRWSAAGPLWIGMLSLALLVFGFGGWAVASRLTGAVIAMGQIEVDQNRQIIQHPDGGVVAEILVREGDQVTEGQLLIRLDAEQLQTELASVEGSCSRCWPAAPGSRPSGTALRN